MKLVGNSEDGIDQAIERLAKVITRETKERKRDQARYDTRITLDDALASSSPTMLRLLSRLSSKLDGSLPAAMTGNMVTCAVTNKPTLLQIRDGRGSIFLHPTQPNPSAYGPNPTDPCLGPPCHTTTTRWSDHFAGRAQDQAPEKDRNV